MNWLEIMRETIDPALGRVTRDLPKRFFHFTHEQSNVEAIVKHGFDLTMFGHTGKKFNMPDMTRYDPAGVYCQDAAEIMNKGYQPWVEFALTGSPVALASSHVFFRDLAKAYDCVGAKLSAALMAHGISVVQNVREFVILDVKLIRLIDWSRV
jgi:hypothetical protein